ncbi:MAG: VWA domain-containing protein [Bacteroidetes bacterium]|nr:VWA domain-containing protein [Bacteroidota bacterium]
MNNHGTSNNGNTNPRHGSAAGGQAPLRTHILCIVDRSGSMQPIATDAMGGYNTFLESQRRLPGEAVMTLVLFDHEYQRVCTAAPLAEAPMLDAGNYVPRGTTALLDAIGRGIEEVRAAGARDGAPGERVIVAILTDGYENASTDYTQAMVAGRIDELQLKHDWEFVYLGANQDAIAVAAQMNISPERSASFAATPAGVQQAYHRMNDFVAFSRAAPPSDDDAKNRKKRGK